MRRAPWPARILSLVLLAAPSMAFSQATEVDQISGTIQDSTGAAVPQAEIRAIRTDTGFVKTVTSNPDGSYILSNLPIGPYRIEVSAQGFKTEIQKGIVLQVNVNPNVN